MIKHLLVFLMLLLSVSTATASTFFVDPDSGSMNNDGSQASPWSTLEAVWTEGKIATLAFPDRPVKSGDTILLSSGYHGNLFINYSDQAINAGYITVKAAPGATPQVHSIYMMAAQGWIFDGLSISYTYGPEPIAKPTSGALFWISSHNFWGWTKNIVLKNCTLFSYMDSSSWTEQNWVDRSINGIFAEYVENFTIDNCRMYNLDYAVAFSSGRYNAIKNSIIDGALGDGIRMGGTSYSSIEYNTIKNMRFASTLRPGDHTDMIQLWATDDTGNPDWLDYGGQNPQRDLIIRGNTVIAHEDPNQPLQIEAQGISGFDGWFENILIENNLIISATSHGITLAGATNCTIINNTVASMPGGTISGPIQIVPHKDRSLGSGSVVRNNICSSIGTADDFYDPYEILTTPITADHNIDNLSSGNISTIFMDPQGFDFSLKSGSPAIDAGTVTGAPTIDIRRFQRGLQVDAGAYEYGAVNSLRRLSLAGRPIKLAEPGP